MKLKNLSKKLGNIGNLEALIRATDNSSNAYVYLYKEFPTSESVTVSLSMKELISYFKDEYKILRAYYHDKDEITFIIFMNEKNRTLICIETLYNQSNSIQFYYQFNNPPIKDIEYAYKYKMTEERSSIHFIIGSSNGLYLQKIAFPIKDINIEDNYNSDFIKVNDKLKQYLCSDKSGIHILHGIPGSGKSYYLKYLINEIDKKFIYCPSSLTYQLAGPDFIKLMLREGSDSILIIEDAEEALMSKGGERNAAVTNILNISDGIIGDSINTQIIATFNTSFDNIDSAITRKGRLLTHYEFKELEVDKAQKLLNSLGVEEIINKSMTLADIYNYKVEGYSKKENKIGL